MVGASGVADSMTDFLGMRRVRTDEEINARESALVIRRRRGLVLGIMRGNAGRGWTTTSTRLEDCGGESDVSYPAVGHGRGGRRNFSL